MTRRISAPPPADVLAEELQLDPVHACEWIVQMWSGAHALEDEVEQLRAYIADLQLEVGV